MTTTNAIHDKIAGVFERAQHVDQSMRGRFITDWLAARGFTVTAATTSWNSAIVVGRGGRVHVWSRCEKWYEDDYTRTFTCDPI